MRMSMIDDEDEDGDQEGWASEGGLLSRPDGCIFPLSRSSPFRTSCRFTGMVRSGSSGGERYLVTVRIEYEVYWVGWPERPEGADCFGRGWRTELNDSSSSKKIGKVKVFHSLVLVLVLVFHKPH